MPVREAEASRLGQLFFNLKKKENVCATRTPWQLFFSSRKKMPVWLHTLLEYQYNTTLTLY